MAFGGHKWLTWDLTYMDCAVAEPETVDLADPFLLAAGRQDPPSKPVLQVDLTPIELVDDSPLLLTVPKTS